jgi:small-conductance mechanosensitive channel
MVKKHLFLLLVFIVISAALFFIDRNGIHIGYFTEVREGSIAMFLGVLAGIAALYEAGLLLVIASVHFRKGATSEVGMLASLMRAVAFLVGIMALIHFFGKLSTSAVFLAGFAGMLMGWSLQAPVSGIAAWVLVSVKRPFRVGDRIMLPAWGLIGDVLKIDMMYTTLNQVGGTVASEEAAGRNILIPNAMLFSNVVINYTPQQMAAFVLDEVVIRITYNSNWELSEKILMNAANEVTGDIIQQTGQKPYIRADMYDYGVYMRLRYMTSAVDRPRIVYEITRKVFSEFQKHPDVDFAIPFIFSHRTGMRTGAWYLDQHRETDTVEVALEKVKDPSGVADLPQNAEQIKGLAEKIAQLGLLQPIVVEQLPDGDYRVVAGHLRLAACKSLGWKVVPAIIKAPGSK